MSTQFDWIQFTTVNPGEDEENLHDSGYRFIQIEGVKRIDGHESRTNLHQRADHITVEGSASINIDVTPEGVTRIMPWYPERGATFSLKNDARPYFSDAEFLLEEGDNVNT